jgi:hypothetical protein
LAFSAPEQSLLYDKKAGYKPAFHVPKKPNASISLLISALTGCFGFFLPPDRGLFVSFSLADLGNDTRACTLLFKAAQSAVQRFIVLYSDFSHVFSLPSAKRQGLSVINICYTINIIPTKKTAVKYSFQKSSIFRLLIKKGKKVLTFVKVHGMIIFALVDNTTQKQQRGIAQLVEQWSPKPRAEGSSPSAPAIRLGSSAG